MNSRYLAVLALAVLTVSSACSSKKTSTKAASGTPKPTTKAPTSAAKPSGTTKPGANVVSAQAGAQPVKDGDAQVSCENEGSAECVGTFAVVCTGGKVVAVDCAEAYPGSTCGTLEGSIDCVETVEE
jgi:hypothetical protein